MTAREGETRSPETMESEISPRKMIVTEDDTVDLFVNTDRGKKGLRGQRRAKLSMRPIEFDEYSGINRNVVSSSLKRLTPSIIKVSVLESDDDDDREYFWPLK